MDVQAIDTSSGTRTAAAAAPAVPVAGELPAFPTRSDGAPKSHEAASDPTLHHALSQLVGGGSKVSVQYQVVGPNEIVTVFKNAETGQVITQFPAEAMVLIAQFFNKLAGAVVDRTA
jgi:hypothetical protein